MKYLLTIIATALMTWVVFSAYSAVKERIKETHHFSSATRPLQICLGEIEYDLKNGRREIALKKVEALNKRIQNFDVEIEKNQLSPIISEYREFDPASRSKSEPDLSGQPM